MIHEIAPHQFNSEYKQATPKQEDILLYFYRDKVLLLNQKDEFSLPTVSQLEAYGLNPTEAAQYVFSIDDTAYFINMTITEEVEGFLSFQPLTVFRTLQPQYQAFAGITASQLYRFYMDNRYCGRCATLMKHSDRERALVCPSCGKTVYPKISPAVIVAITDGTRLLMTKYRDRHYTKYALVAGFVEIGESFEEAVKREVMEEVGLKIKNIRYYKSSPWAFSDTMMVGYFAELDGDDTITLQESELAEAQWFEKEEIPVNPSTLSISYELVECVRQNIR